MPEVIFRIAQKIAFACLKSFDRIEPPEKKAKMRVFVDGREAYFGKLPKTRPLTVPVSLHSRTGSPSRVLAPAPGRPWTCLRNSDCSRWLGFGSSAMTDRSTRANWFRTLASCIARLFVRLLTLITVIMREPARPCSFWTSLGYADVDVYLTRDWLGRAHRSKRILARHYEVIVLFQVEPPC